MERSEWMKNQRSSDFISGVIEFMNLAESTKRRIGDAYYILCPCTDCANIESHEVADVQMHLVSRGFMLGNVVISKKILRTHRIMVMHSNERGECCPRTLVDRKRKR